MDYQAAIDNVLAQSVESFNQTVAPDQQLKNANDMVIFGPGSNLDSLGFVNFVVTIESEVESQLGKTIFIVDEQSLEMAENPFRTIGSLKQLLVQKVQNA